MGDLDQSLGALVKAIRSLGAEFNSIWFPIQLGLILLTAVIAVGLARLAQRRIDLASLMRGWPELLRQVIQAVVDNLGVIIFTLAVAATRAGLLDLTRPSHSYLLGVAANLATAWIVINLLAALIKNHFVNRIVAVFAWTIAALSILGLLGHVATLLDSIAIVIGGLRISLFLVLKTSVLLLATLWLAIAVANFLDRQLRSAADLTPSLQVLIGKLLRLALVTFSIAIVLGSVGIDLSALALFSGAVGLGVGFGLQKIVSNLVSGIILLADKSIKPGDVISVGENFGWVDSLGARYTSVVVRDGREVLIPNEDLVTHQVINWSHSNDRVRLEVEFGVSYTSDPHKVRRVAVEVVEGLPRILKAPAPFCHLIKFNDFSLDFVLRFWIRDPIDGITNVRGNVMLALWDAFKREGIEIPFPVRDVRIRNSAPKAQS